MAAAVSIHDGMQWRLCEILVEAACWGLGFCSYPSLVSFLAGAMLVSGDPADVFFYGVLNWGWPIGWKQGWIQDSCIIREANGRYGTLEGAKHKN